MVLFRSLVYLIYHAANWPSLSNQQNFWRVLQCTQPSRICVSQMREREKKRKRERDCVCVCERERECRKEWSNQTSLSRDVIQEICMASLSLSLSLSHTHIHTHSHSLSHSHTHILTKAVVPNQCSEDQKFSLSILNFVWESVTYTNIW